MSLSIRIMLPVFPSHCNVNFKGFITLNGQREIIIYITEYTTKPKLIWKQEYAENTIFGHCSYQRSQQGVFSANCLILESYTINSVNLKHLMIQNEPVSSVNDCIVMLYNYKSIRDSESLESYVGDYISQLKCLIQKESKSLSENSDYKQKLNTPKWLTSSMFIQHLLNYLNLFCWLFCSVKRDKKVFIKQGNLLLAIITDVLLGYLMFAMVTMDKADLSSLLMGAVEHLVNMLYNLLKWLMGAPAGLKLNNAFNKLLGKYFSYHIQLWWLFLDVSGEKLDIILDVYSYIGYLGFTFQAAMISDLISIATFHSYCIYVYAARLFSIQISGLVALLRLFVGRKYNPLRGGIDSCEYTNQELFVGTVAFTILLLLLPTTAMYYFVFTLFRVLALTVQNILAKLIYFVQTLPLYAVFLWMIRSPRVAGNVLIEVVNNRENSPLILKINIFHKPVSELISKFQPPVEVPKQLNWTNMLSNVFIGKQII